MTTYRCTLCKKDVAEAPWFNQHGDPYHHACYAQRFGSNSVVVRDIQMPFGSMVAFMLKLGLAAIPVGLILGMMWWVIAAACGVTP